MKLVNCGCGGKYSKAGEWVNIDFTKREDVIGHNLLEGLPLESNSVDAVFSSCMLEHFSPDQGRKFLLECYRVLVRGGICRIVVPDLENICREYLDVLDKIRSGADCEKQYEYIVIELIDQMTRTEPGGEMAKYWERDDRDEEYILKRTGYPEIGEIRTPTLIDKIVGRMYLMKEKTLHCLFSGTKWYRARNLGRFMLSGEVHKWMYDSYGLMKLMRETGFRNIKVMSYNQSNIKGWKEWGIETNPDGSEYKPNCLYMEAVK